MKKVMMIGMVVLVMVYVWYIITDKVEINMEDEHSPEYCTEEPFIGTL